MGLGERFVDSNLLRFVDSNLPGKFPMGLEIPPPQIKILPESNPLKSRILVGRLAAFNDSGERTEARVGLCSIVWRLARTRDSGIAIAGERILTDEIGTLDPN